MKDPYERQTTRGHSNVELPASPPPAADTIVPLTTCSVCGTVYAGEKCPDTGDPLHNILASIGHRSL